MMAFSLRLNMRHHLPDMENAEGTSFKADANLLI